MIKNYYKDDYSYTPRLSQKGRVVDDICYVGDYYILPFDKKQKKKTIIENFLYVIAILALQILSGCINPDSSRTAWIVFPYFFIFIPIGYMFMGAVEYIRTPLKMQKVQFERSIERMRRSGIGIIIFTVISMVLDIVFMILHASNMNVLREILYFSLHLAIIAVVLLFSRFYNRNYAGILTEPSGNKLE